jgi:hypothetical protein
MSSCDVCLKPPCRANVEHGLELWQAPVCTSTGAGLSGAGALKFLYDGESRIDVASGSAPRKQKSH